MTDDRAESAFRTALARAADGYDVVPLAPLTPRRRRTLPALVAAAAVLLLVGSVAFVATRGAPARPDGATDPGIVDGLPSGWHWESSRDAIVAVPDSWGYAFAADSQWCVGDGAADPPSKPFVDLHSPLLGSTLVGCPAQEPANFTGIPERLLRTYLTFPWHDDVPDGTRSWHGWTQITRHVGSAVIQVLSDREHLAIAQQVIDSAQQVNVDGNGCPARSDIQRGGFVRPKPAVNVKSLDSVDRIAICQYRLAYPGKPEGAEAPGLIASRSLEGDQATSLLGAIQAAPGGGGPNQPDSCLHEMSGDAASVLLLTTGDQTHELYAYYDWCIGNGIDDGTTLRTLTADTCAPLFGDRVFWGGGGGQLVDLCYQDRG